MRTVTDRTNLFAKACGALSLTAALLTAGYPCNLVAWAGTAQAAETFHTISIHFTPAAATGPVLADRKGPTEPCLPY